jgi:hypothetical protein
VVAASPEVEESPDWQSLPSAGTPPGGDDGTAAPPPAGADDPPALVPPAPPGPGVSGRPLRRQHLAAPRRIRMRTLLRRGLPLRVACEPACHVRVRLLAPPRRRTASRRELRVGPVPKRLRLRVTRRAAARLQAARARRLVVRATFTRPGEKPQVREARVRLRG